MPPHFRWQPTSQERSYSQKVQKTGRLWILKKGAVVVVRQGVEIAKVAEPGAVFGDISALPAIAESEHDVPIGLGRLHRRKLGDLLHADREPQSVLDKAKYEMGSMAFAAQYQQQPVTEDGTYRIRSR